MKKAGLEGYKFKLSTMDSKGILEAGLLFKEHAAKAGINIDVIKKTQRWNTLVMCG